MKLTIFTPTYNRAQTLPRLYDSLKRQTNKNFVWLIVDDGSEDNTKSLVDAWTEEKLMEIKYIYQQNSGKMQAHNCGVDNTETELFLCVDSDDYLVDDAVEQILNAGNQIMSNNNIAGLIAGKGDTDGRLLGSGFPKGVQNSTLNDLYRIGFVGDTTLVFKAEVLKGFKFPRFGEEKFVTEDYVYCQIDEQYTYQILPQIITICEYLEDGYTKGAIKLLLNNPMGANSYYNLKIKLAKSFKEKCMFVIRYAGIGKLTKVEKLFKNCNSKILYFLLFPLGYLYYKKKKKLVKGL